MEDAEAFAAYNVTALFPGTDAARQAIESLEHAGVHSSRFSLLGPGGEQAADVRDTSEVDESVITKGLKSTLGGAAAGSGIGGAAGLIAGLVAFGVPGVGPVLASGIWATTLGGVAAGGGVGFVAGAMTKMQQSQAWELTLQDVNDGHFVVGVHTDDEKEFRVACDTLARREPSHMREFDQEGNEVGHPAE